MPRAEQPEGSAARTAAQFATTHWSVVLAAGHTASLEAQPALEAHTAEERYRLEPVDRLDPERLYERRWAMPLLDHALRRLETEYLADGRSRRIDLLKAFAVEEMDARACGEVTRQLASTEGTVRTALHRLRQRYREVVREEIAQTVADPADVDLEIQHLHTLREYDVGFARLDTKPRRPPRVFHVSRDRARKPAHEPPILLCKEWNT